MGQFKPMVKMMTTEPTVELKLKKGGSATHKKLAKMEAKAHGTGHKMMDGGAAMGMRGAPMIGGPAMSAPVMAPKKPSASARLRAAMGRAPIRRLPMPGMKEGGESKAEHAAEMEKMAKTSKELKKHESMPASKAHKGLKTGGVVMGQGGFKDGGIIKSTKGETKMHTAEYTGKTSGKTGEVKKGNAGGYKKGGRAMGGSCYAEGGKVRGPKGMGVEGNVSSTPPGKTNTATGDVKLGNAGGYKKGGAAKKAEGGAAKKPVDKPKGAVTEVERQIVRKAVTPGFKGKPFGRAMPMDSDVTPPPGSPMPDEGFLRELGKGPNYRKGGAAKKAGGAAKYATGGSVNDSGRPEKMPQGHKPPSPMVRMTQLTGTFKKGGKVCK